MTSSTDEAPRWIAAGRVGRPHGLNGSFHVTGAIPRLLEVGTQLRVKDDGSTRRDDALVVHSKIKNKIGTQRDPIVSLDGVDDRDAALRLRGCDLLVAVADAPSLQEGEWWAHELVGCLVRDGEVEVGTVTRLVELPSCEALEVRREAGPDLLVPMVADAVRKVDVKSKQIDVDLRFLGESF